MTMQLVRITNPSKRGDPNYRTLHMVHQDEVIDIEPGGERIVPFEVAQSFFGHPAAKDGPRERYRTDTYAYLRAMWNYQDGAIDAAERWARDYPPFRVLTLEGKYLPMVLDDPQGVLPLPDDPEAQEAAVDPSVKALQAALAEQQAKSAQLEALLTDLLAKQNPGVVADTPAADATVDATNLPKADAKEKAPVADSPRQPGGFRRHK